MFFQLKAEQGEDAERQRQTGAAEIHVEMHLTVGKSLVVFGQNILVN